MGDRIWIWTTKRKVVIKSAKKVRAEVKQIRFKVPTAGSVTLSKFIFLICKRGMKKELTPQIIIKLDKCM